jgi:acyl carrier protein
MEVGKVEHAEQAVAAIVEDLVQDWGLDLEQAVGPGTKLVEDLTFESVDIIQLCVALEQHYGRKLDFQNLLMVDGSYIGDLSIGQIGGFIDAKLAG